jgi:hypothetical protein
MSQLRAVTAVLIVALACAPKHPAPETPSPETAAKPTPKPNIDPGRIPADKAKLTRHTPTAGCHSRAPA